MSLRISGRPTGRSSISSRSLRGSVFLRGFRTVTRRMAASFDAYRGPSADGGRPFGREFLIGAGLSVAAVTVRLSAVGITPVPATGPVPVAGVVLGP